MTAQPIARTGRVQNWIDDPTSRLPVSCTVFVVEDGMEGRNGIQASWQFVSHGLRNGAGCSVHLSKLRPCGADNGKGLVASGPVSFAKIYSTLNETLRRGGVYKNGAVVIHLDWDHPDILDRVIDGKKVPGFINTPRKELSWVKRCVDVPSDLLDRASPELITLLLEGIKRGDIWLNKIRYDEYGQRIYGNVCLEVYLKSRATCLLQHINYGACRPEDLPMVYQAGMDQLCILHGKTGVGETGEYLDPSVDRQVGLGLIGLANFLAQEQVTYLGLADALDRYFVGTPDSQNRADYLVAYMAEGIQAAAKVARKYNMDRAFAIAPTASCSYKHIDLRGYTTTPEIAPPISRHVDRDSGTFGVESFDYPPDCEIAAEVGWDTFKRVADGIVRLYQDTLLFHGYSFNSWSDVVTYDEDFLREWLKSPQTSLYYSLQVMPDTQAKDDALGALNEEFHEFFKFDEIDTSQFDNDDEEIEGFCPTDGSCSSCAE
jgi:hypothetical protein